MNSTASATATRIIAALDVPTAEDAARLVKLLSGRITFFKIGLQLFTAAGPDIVRRVQDFGAKVFLDLKLHDIPNTVAKAVENAGKLGVEMLTIHLSGGGAMIAAAVKARTEATQLLGVTVLTSIDQETLRETGVSGGVQDQVVRLARLGRNSGIDGFVASPREVSALRENLGPGVTLVIPGVRPAWAEAGDQKRTMPPADIIRAGADYLVVGRPITGQADPVAALDRLCAEIA